MLTFSPYRQFLQNMAGNDRDDIDILLFRKVYICKHISIYILTKICAYFNISLDNITGVIE